MPPSPQEIEQQCQQLYESAPLREDLNDAEAEVLLKWGAGQVARLAAADPADFDQACRFLRQLIKHINRFVGQREYNDAAGQAEYMAKVQQWLPKLGYAERSVADLMAALPPDPKDMAQTLAALLHEITPADAAPAPADAAPAPADATPQMDNPPKSDTIGHTLSSIIGDIFGHDEKSD